MKLSDHILRKPFYVAFGQAQQGGGITSVDLVATRDATTVTMTASDGSAAPIAGAGTRGIGSTSGAGRDGAASIAGCGGAGGAVDRNGLPMARALNSMVIASPQQIPVRAFMALTCYVGKPGPSS